MIKGLSTINSCRTLIFFRQLSLNCGEYRNLLIVKKKREQEKLKHLRKKLKPKKSDEKKTMLFYQWKEKCSM